MTSIWPRHVRHNVRRRLGLTRPSALIALVQAALDRPARLPLSGDEFEACRGYLGLSLDVLGIELQDVIPCASISPSTLLRRRREGHRIAESLALRILTARRARHDHRLTVPDYLLR